MKKYCRYCVLAKEGDGYYYCIAYHKILSGSVLKSTNNCPDYEYCGVDVITGKEHDDGSEQIRMDEVSE